MSCYLQGLNIVEKNANLKVFKYIAIVRVYLHQ